MDLSSRQYIPYYPSLPPRLLMSRPADHLPFPLSADRHFFYYFARNGIWHAIDLLGLTADTEVLMPAYNNGMELAPFVHRGVPLVFYRVDRRMNIDLEDLVQKITSRTRVLYLTYYLGFPQPVDTLRRLCAERGIILFEDCALSFLSEIDGQPQGSFGDLSIFCLPKFTPIPNGGVLVLNEARLGTPPPTHRPSRYYALNQLASKMLDHLEVNGALAARAFRSSVDTAAQGLIRLLGLTRVDSGLMEFLPEAVDWGMSEISSAILSRLDYGEVKRRRRRNFQYLLERTLDLPGTRPVFEALPEGVCPLFFPLLVHDNQHLCRLLRQRSVSAGGFWHWNPPALPLERFPDTAWLRQHVLELQVHQDLEPPHLDYTLEQLRWALREAGGSSFDPG